jgi:hypothetical protein
MACTNAVAANKVCTGGTLKTGYSSTISRPGLIKPIDHIRDVDNPEVRGGTLKREELRIAVHDIVDGVASLGSNNDGFIPQRWEVGMQELDPFILANQFHPWRLPFVCPRTTV